MEEYKRRCRHCAYLVEGDSGEWRCDIDYKECELINFCDAVEQ